MKFKDRARLLGHQHLKTFLDDDSVQRVFICRLGRTRQHGLSRSVFLWGRLPQGGDPVFLFLEVMLEKHDHAEARGSNSVYCLPHFLQVALSFPKTVR